MNEVSTLRLYLLRAVYIFMFAGLAFTIWPHMISQTGTWTLWRGVGCSMLCAVSILALLGVRYPLKMLPVLFFELIWKSIWFFAIALPLLSAGKMDVHHMGTLKDCIPAVIILIVIPWSYVCNNYIKKKGDRWLAVNS